MAHPPHHRGRTHRLTAGASVHFPGETLFARLARTVCAAECLPRKELYESWEVARRVVRRFKGGRLVELAAGHGLLSHIMCLLDPTLEGAVAVDRRLPPSAQRLASALIDRWPQLEGRVRLVEGDIRELPLSSSDAVVGVHACGVLTDVILDRALEAEARVAVLPCCHAQKRSDTGGLLGWVDPSLAIDVTRAARLRSAGYQVHTATIPEEITPKARLLFGAPRRATPP